MKNDVVVLEKVLKAFANKRRLLMLAHIRSEGLVTVSNVAKRAGLSMRATSRHLNVLYSAGVVEKNQQGLYMWYSICHDTHPCAQQIIDTL